MARIGNKNRSLQISGILCAAFVLLLLLVKIIDVRHIGPNYTKVGFAALNGLFYKIGYHPFWYGLTQVLGILALVVALAFALLGVAIIQVRRRLPEGQTKQIVIYVFYALLVILIVGRIISGVHWFTDICGGVLLGFALTYLYQGLLESFEGSSGKHAK